MAILEDGRNKPGSLPLFQSQIMDCDFETRAGTEEEILKKAAAHAQTVHNMKDIPKEVLEKVRAAIRDE